jgi:hypothetical protein
MDLVIDLRNDMTIKPKEALFLNRNEGCLLGPQLHVGEGIVKIKDRTRLSSARGFVRAIGEELTNACSIDGVVVKKIQF